MVGLLESLAGRPIIYEAHNVETDLKRSLLLGHPAYQQLIASAEKCERTAIAKSTEILISPTPSGLAWPHSARRTSICTSFQTASMFRRCRSANDFGSYPRESYGRHVLIFIGSAHPPNVEAAKYIIESLSPKMPDLIFALVGSICEALSPRCASNVIQFGRLDDATKDVVVELAAVALNPMLSGSGSNLKLAEYFSKSRPTITTPFGSRGYAITNEHDAIICPLTISGTNPLPPRKSAEAPRTRAAATFAKTNLDWKLQAQRFRRVLERTVFASRKRQLLVVTHRFTDPPMGGAETYLLER